jgi:hypothetical protein
MEISTEAPFKQIKKVLMENIFSLMEIHTMDILRMTLEKAQENIILLITLLSI